MDTLEAIEVLNQKFISFMLQIPHIYDCIIPRWSRNIELLHVIYCLPHIEKLIDQKIYKIRPLFDHIEVRYITDEELIFYAEDPSDLFYTINRQSDIPPSRYN